MTQGWNTLAEKQAIEAMPLADRWPAETVYAMLLKTAAAHPRRLAISFQIKSGPRDKAETLDWTRLADQVTRTANLFRRLGIGAGDVVAYLLPNCNEAVLTLLGGVTAGIVKPINPLLDAAQIAALLRESGAKALVTLAPFPKTDVAQKAHAAVALAPSVEVVMEVDLKRYLTPPIAWLIPPLRPRVARNHHARVLNFNAALMAEDGAALSFAEGDGAERTGPDGGDRIAAYFHTGGTTGMPKVAQHRQRGMVYNGLIPSMSTIDETDVLICPLPLFHVFGAYVILMACVASGAHMVMPTPAGYRGDGVMDNFWALVERWRVSFMVMVPTAASALMQRPVNADVSSLKYALCGSAPLPVELYKRFEAATGVKILEGYGMTEATCLVSMNPPEGERKIGSVGLPVPYTQVKILDCETDGTIRRECGTDEIGEICIASPAVFPGYTEPGRNVGLFAEPGHYLRSGDLGRLDADGYVWITGRAKDLIIRGGHNIDPAMIEEALAGHPAVAFVGVIGQPDAHSGEVPCAYVELIDGATATVEELLAFADRAVPEDAAVPKYIEVMDELPKTAVGKIFKPDLRKMAIARVYGAALAKADIDAAIEIVEDKTRGLVARITPRDGAEASDIGEALAQFTRPWELVE
ncbi:MAG TPA: acyl-CoA synthetase [Thermohalobaculum sp.]|nr:acyl-CoA synthetase [Thermohalobaculum sp.]